MNIAEEFDRILLLCGGNFDRQDTLDLEIANARDIDFINVMNHRKKWKVSYLRYKRIVAFDIFLFIITIPMIGVSVIQGFNIKNLSIPSNLNEPIVFLSIAIPIAALIIWKLLQKYQKRYTSLYRRLERVLGKDLFESGNDKKAMKEYYSIVRKEYPDSAEAYWLPPEGHVSDAQILPFLIERTHQNVSAIFAGQPYFDVYFADSICFRVMEYCDAKSKLRADPQAYSLRQQRKMIREIIERVTDEHVIGFFMALGKDVPGNETVNKPKRFTRNPYIFGISFLSKLLKEVYKSFGNEDDMYVHGKNRPIGIHFDDKYNINNSPEPILIRDLRAIRFLIQSSSPCDYVEIFDDDIPVKFIHGTADRATKHRICCTHLMITDIVQMMNPKQKDRGGFDSIVGYRSINYAKNKGDMRIPLKRALVLERKLPCMETWALTSGDERLVTYRESMPTRRKNLVIVMGGAEQNYALQAIVADQTWSTSQTCHYQFYENVFFRMPTDFCVSTEDLVHAFYRQKDRERIRILVKEERRISAHVYSICSAQKTILGIYGYNAYSSKIIAMCLIYILTGGAQEFKPPIHDHKSKKLIEIEEFQNLVFSNKPFLIQITPHCCGCSRLAHCVKSNEDLLKKEDTRILDTWDNHDIINNHIEFGDFFKTLRFEVGDDSDEKNA